MAKVGFVLKPSAEDARALADELARWLVACGHTPVFADDAPREFPGDRVPATALAEVDVLCCLGGDGTILGASRLLGDACVPVLGVNLGQLGFLAGFLPGDAQAALTAALAGNLRVEERSRLSVTLYRAGHEPTVAPAALNDAVLHQGAMARILDCDAYIDDAFVASYRADGLIISTPTGSTAYNMAAGGPILIPGAAGMTLTPICAHSLTNRPLVVPARSIIRLAIHAGAREAVLTVDGQWAEQLRPGDRVEITAAPRPLRLLAGNQSYFDVMRDKLHWGLRGAKERDHG